MLQPIFMQGSSKKFEIKQIVSFTWLLTVLIHCLAQQDKSTNENTVLVCLRPTAMALSTLKYPEIYYPEDISKVPKVLDN